MRAILAENYCGIKSYGIIHRMLAKYRGILVIAEQWQWYGNADRTEISE